MTVPRQNCENNLNFLKKKLIEQFVFQKTQRISIEKQQTSSILADKNRL